MEATEKQYRNVVEAAEKSFNDEERSITHIISVEVSDRYGDIVRADGMDKSHYEKNPVVLYGHDSSSLPVGKSLWQKKTVLADGRKAIIAKTKFADTPEGNTVYSLWKDGFLNAASIGFLPKVYEPMIDGQKFIGYDIKQWELLEYSIVPIPANQEALRLHLDEMGENLVVKSLREQMKQQVQSAEEKRVMDEAIAKMAELEQKVADLNAKINEMESNQKSITKNVAEIVAEKRKRETEKFIADSVGRAISDIKQKS